MAKVIAISKGYYGGEIRNIGDRFDMPDPDAKITPWVRPDPAVAFGGKGDHDGDGFVGGSLPKEKTEADDAPKRRGRKPKAEPFADAPEPVTITEAQAEVGGIQPDWLPPSE